MKRMIFSCLFAAFFGSTSYASEGPEPVGDYSIACHGKGASFYFNLDEKVAWQSEPKEKEGLRLTLTDVTAMRCPGCYTIQGQLELFGDSLLYLFRIEEHQSKSSMVLTLTAKGEEPSSTGGFSCKKR